MSKGFTLIELLAVIVILSILAGFGLPFYLSQANKARQAEAITNISTINKAQQSYYLEEDFFATGISKLQIGVPTQTEFYQYDTRPQSETQAASGAKRIKGFVKEYSGIIWITEDQADNKMLYSRICTGTLEPTTDCD